MGTVTIGVSIAVPEPSRQPAPGAARGLRRPRRYGIPTHVTLLPPTEVGGGACPAVEAHLAQVAAAGRPFPMRLSGTGTFRPLSPVVYVRVVEGAEACAWLQQRVRDASGPRGPRTAVPLPPARHRRPRHRRGGDGPRLRGARRLRGRSGPAPASRSTSRARDGVWRKLREFPFGGSVVPPQAAPPRPRLPADALTAVPAGRPPVGVGSDRQPAEHRRAARAAAPTSPPAAPPAPTPSPSGAAAPVRSAVGDRLRRGRERRLRRPAVILGRTNPGRTTITCTPGAVQRVAQALGEGVQARLAGAVDEVRRGGPAPRRPRTARPASRGPAPAGPARTPGRPTPRPCSWSARPAPRPAGSRSSRAWSPRMPKASSTMSMSPSANTLPSTASWDSGSSASKATVRTSAPSARSSSAAASSAGEGRPASHTVRVRRVISRRAVASAISDVPPRTSRDWGTPKASFTATPRGIEGDGTERGDDRGCP